jgi:cytochrome c553
MYRTVAVAAILLWMHAPSVLAGPPRQPKAEGIEAEDYKWAKFRGEFKEGVLAVGDAGRGKKFYEVCAACHLSSGAGRADGMFPQIAGQHVAVIIKQMADIRFGVRDNPVMYPYAATLNDPQELADIAAYIRTLKIPHDNGKGAGTNLKRGEELYRSDCVECHGRNGEGSERKFYPVLAGQHYTYLLRQALEIRDGKRRNADPHMVRVIKDYSNADIGAVVDYMSRLTMPERAAKAKKSGK